MAKRGVFDDAYMFYKTFLGCDWRLTTVVIVKSKKTGQSKSTNRQLGVLSSISCQGSYVADRNKKMAVFVVQTRHESGKRGAYIIACNCLVLDEEFELKHMSKEGKYKALSGNLMMCIGDVLYQYCIFR